MTGQSPTRRTVLSRVTSATLSLGVLVAGGALARSCAPRPERTSAFDLSDMQIGEMRYYVFGAAPEIIIRNDNTLTSWDAICPISNGLGFLQYDSFTDGFWCSHCTNRFSRAGVLINRDGSPSTWARADDYHLEPGAARFDDLTIVLTETDAAPRFAWSSL